MRRTPLRPSRGTQWPIEESNAIYARDKGRCVGPVAGLPGDCYGQTERHHVRASHGMGMKSESTRYNGVLLCNGAHHPWATVHGREARPLLLAYLDRFYGDTPHVHEWKDAPDWNMGPGRKAQECFPCRGLRSVPA